MAALVRFFGNVSAFLCSALVVVVSMDALIRYFFNISYSWVIELEWHIFSLIFLLAFAYTLSKDRHVRVDILYNRFLPETKKKLDIIGHLMFLIPWSILIFVTSWKFVQNSYLIGEGSPNPDGLPHRFVVKSAILIGFLLLLLQALLSIIQDMIWLKQKK